MNTIRSVGYGWGVLILAGGGSYYFAKRSINADRAERAAAEEKRRQTQYRLRAQESVSRDQALTSSDATQSTATKDRLSPSQQNTEDPAAVSHATPDIPQSKYESTQPFRSRKGDRFS